MQQHMQGFVCGVQHSTCPLPVREALAKLNPEDVAKMAKKAGASEAMVLSTCNRFEIYGYGHTDYVKSDIWTGLLAAFSSFPPEQLQPLTYVKHEAEMVQHGFGVASSIYSMVVGEPQILGQMKQAWQQSQKAGHSGVFLDRFATTALHVGKRVRTETDIAKEAVSVASVGVRLARDIYGDLKNCTVLLLGAGEMGENAAQFLQASGVKEMLVMNRSAARAKGLAAKFSANMMPLSLLDEALLRADVVVTSTSTPQYVLTKQHVQKALKARKKAPMLFIDLALPRDVDPLVHRLDNAYVYDLDALGSLAQKAQEKRKSALLTAGEIIAEEAAGFMQWQQTRAQVAAIKALRQHFYDLRAEVLEKQNLDGAEATRRLLNKILHTPSKVLNERTLPEKALQEILNIFGLKKN